MKKVFFAFVAASVVVLSSCNNQPAAETDATATDTAAVVEAVEETAAVVDSAAAVVDSAAAPAAH